MRAPSYQAADPALQAYGRMLFLSLWPDGGGFTSYASELAALRSEPAAREDLRASMLDTCVRRSWPLDYVSIDGRKPNSFRECALFRAGGQQRRLPGHAAQVGGRPLPKAMYQDYAISPDLFHGDSVEHDRRIETGQRHLNHHGKGTHVLLFARSKKFTDFGSGVPYLFLGEADYVEHRGERPIAIMGRLHTPVPPADFATASAVA